MPQTNRSSSLSALAGALVALFASEVMAGQPPAVRPPDPQLVGGELVGKCQWSMVGALTTSETGCTAVLIHPQMIATAGHCTYQTTDWTVRFGETAAYPMHTIGIDACWIPDAYDPQLGSGDGDIAFCRLVAPVDLPVIPPAYGCELEALSIGTEVTVVGYGEPEWTKKQWKTSVLMSEYELSNTAVIGGPDPVSCSGDSGGPALIQLEDGSWRVFAVSSRGQLECGVTGPSYFAWMHEWIPWVEAESGIDLTPCHDADGTWNPTPLCKGFALDPFDPGNGDWKSWCAGAPVSGPGESCGPAPAPDSEPPSVAIVEPLDQAFYEQPPVLDVLVEANDGPWPVATVELFIDGSSVALDDAAPWAFEQLAFPEGSWSLVVHATDLSGNVAESEPVEIFVGTPPPEPEPEPEPDDGGTDTGASETGDELGLTDADGCGCTADRGAGGGAAALALGLLLLVRPRRSRPDRAAGVA